MILDLPSPILRQIMQNLGARDLSEIAHLSDQFNVLAQQVKARVIQKSVYKILNGADYDKYALFEINPLTSELNPIPIISNFENFDKQLVENMDLPSTNYGSNIRNKVSDINKKSENLNNSSSRSTLLSQITQVKQSNFDLLLQSPENLGLSWTDLNQLKNSFYQTETELRVQMRGIKLGETKQLFNYVLRFDCTVKKPPIQNPKFHNQYFIEDMDSIFDNKEILSCLGLNSFNKYEGKKLSIGLAICGNLFVIVRGKVMNSALTRRLVNVAIDLAEKFHI